MKLCMKFITTRKELPFLLCFLLIGYLTGCNAGPERGLSNIRRSFDKTFSEGKGIIQNEGLTKSEKVEQLGILLVRLDSLSTIWENSIAGSVENLTESEIDRIENANRIRSEELIRAVLQEMPEYKALLRENLIFNINE